MSLCFHTHDGGHYLTLTTFSSKLTWLSGCAGGNGVYSLFTVFFFGSRRLARFLWRNFGRKRSQLCIRSSGSLDSSRLIISVWRFQQSEYGIEGGWSGINKIATLWCHATWAACANLYFYYHQLSILSNTDVLLLAVTFQTFKIITLNWVPAW